MTEATKVGGAKLTVHEITMLDDNTPCVILTGSAEDVREAAKLWGLRVTLSPARSQGGAE